MAEKMKKTFLSEKFTYILAAISVISGLAALVLNLCFNQTELLTIFDEIVKLSLTILALWSFSRLHWDTTESMIGGLLFALLYQEGFAVLGKLWGQISDFDSFLIMGVQGSLYLSAQSMSFLMTIIIIINHFIIDYSHISNDFNVLFSHIAIAFKIFLYIFLMILNGFLKEPWMTQLIYGFECLANMCIIFLLVCLDTQLDSFRDVRQELRNAKGLGKKHE